MARPALATVEDLEVLLGQPASNPTQAQALLEQASAIVRAYATVTWLNADETELDGVPPDVPGVVTRMVERATRNPQGITQEQAGPYTRSFGPEAAQRIHMDKWDRLVVRAALGTASGISVLDTTRGPIETAAVACDTSDRAEDTLSGITGLLGGS